MSELFFKRSAPGNTRLDVMLSEESKLTRSQITKLIESGYAEVNGNCIKKAGYKPNRGDEISLYVPPVRESRVMAEDLPLDIVYQDADIAVINKPSGMVVHPAAGNETHTLVSALMYHLTDLSGIGGEKRPGIVHRLDKDTSGLLIIAKNDRAHLMLSKQFQKREMEKTYLAVVEGCPKEDHGTINAPIGRHAYKRKQMAVVSGGRESITKWDLTESYRHASLLSVKPVTGRTHQIRVHLAYIHHPVAGDPIYGFSKGVKATRLMLHAYSVCFRHPLTGEPLTFKADLPEDYQQVLNTLCLH